MLSRGVKKHVFKCYMVPLRAIKIMTYFVKHPVHLVFGYNRTLGIILILDSCHVTWSTTYIPNGYPNYSPGQYLSSEQKPLFQ